MNSIEVLEKYWSPSRELPAPVSDTELAEILEGAAEIIDERGWCRNTFADEAGRLCLMGAVMVDLNRRGLGTGAHFHGVEHRLVLEFFPEHPGGPIGWNDKSAHDGAQVTDKMRMIAKDLRNRATPE